MLAEPGRRQAGIRPRAIEVNRSAHQRNSGDRLHDGTVLRLNIGQSLADRVDRPRRNACFFKLIEPISSVCAMQSAMSDTIS